MDIREGFSIREYMLEMRSVHVAKCWPFDDSSTEESVYSMLPPVTVKKFVWWIDCLQKLELKTSKHKRKVLDNGESSLRREDDAPDFDSEAMEVINASSSRARAKTPKKRSILEIFAAAPPVERVSTDEEDNGFHEKDEFPINSKLSRHEKINWGFEGKRTKKKTKKKNNKYKQIAASKLKKATKVINKIRKTTTSQKEDDKPNEENCFMQKHKDKAAGDQTSTCSKRENKNHIHDPVSIYKEIPRQQHLDAAETTSCEMLRLIAQNQHPKNLKSGILKNHAKACSLQQSEKCILPQTSLANHNGKQKADKHVTFVEKVDPVRQLKEPSLLEECFKLPLHITSDLIDAPHPDGLGKDSTIVGTSESEDASTKMEDDVDCRPSSKEQLTKPLRPVDASAFMKQCDRKQPCNRSIDSKNKDLFDVGLSGISNDPRCIFPPRFSCLPCETYYSSRDTKVTTIPSSCTGEILIEDLVQERANKISQLALLQSMCSSADRYQAENIYGKRIGGINEDFVRLPLNLKGEFMLSSNAKAGLNKMAAQNSTGSPPHSLSSLPNTLSKCFGRHLEHNNWDCRTPSRDHTSLFQSNGHLKENHAVLSPSRLDMNEYEENRKINLDLDLMKIQNHSFYQENSLCNEGGWIPEASGNEKILPTMRLMGKEFTVGEQGFQEFENESSWKDKQVIDELHFTNMLINDRMIHDRNDPSSGKLSETLFQPSDNTVNNRNMSSFMHFERSCHGLSQGTCSTAYNSSESSFLKFFPRRYESHICQLELPMLPAANQHPCRSVNSSDFQLMKKQNLLHTNQSPLFCDVSEEGTLMSKFQNHRNFGSSHSSFLIPGTNHWVDSAVPLKPETSWLNNSLLGSTLKRPIGASSPPTLLTQQVPFLSHPTVSPISSVRKRRGNQKIGEKTKSRVGFRARIHGGIAKHHPSAASNTSSKAVAPTFMLEESSRCDYTMPTTNVNFEDAQKTEITTESCPATNKSKSLLDTGGDDQLDQRIHSRTVSCNCTAMAGPIKLTSGGKHILKACQQILQSSSASAHSNTPLTASTPARWQQDDLYCFN